MLDHPIVNQVRRLAEKYPDARYHSPKGTTCYYDDGKVVNGPRRKGCIMREVVQRYKPGLLSEPMAISSVLDDVLPYAVVAWLGEVQEAQDHGYTWSEAVETADREALEK